MTFVDACAVLVDAPFHLTTDQIGRLTPYQANRIYGHRRDKEGRVEPTGSYDPPATYESMHRSRCFYLGIPDWRCKKWLAGLQKSVR